MSRLRDWEEGLDFLVLAKATPLCSRRVPYLEHCNAMCGRTDDLDRLSRYMMMFYAQQPVDWLMVSFRLSMGQRQEMLRKPTLFQHLGLKSSLESKHDNRLKDRSVLRYNILK